MIEAEAGASSETKQRRGSLIRRTFPLIWASVLEPKPGRESGGLGEDREGRAYDLYRGTLAE